MKAQIEDINITSEIEKLIAPGLEANKWRPDIASMKQKRLWAENYQKNKIKSLKEFVGDLAGKSILDLGCGKGGLTVALRCRGAEVTACDMRKRNCRITNLRGQRYGLKGNSVVAQGEMLPFSSKSFDLVICLEVLEHVQSPLSVIEELSRVLRPGGHAWITVVNRFCYRDPHYHIWFLWAFPHCLARLLIGWMRRTKKSSGDRQEITDMHYFSYRQFVQMAKNYNFRISDFKEHHLRLILKNRGLPKSQRIKTLIRINFYRLLRFFSFWSTGYTFFLMKKGSSVRISTAV